MKTNPLKSPSRAPGGPGVRGRWLGGAAGLAALLVLGPAWANEPWKLPPEKTVLRPGPGRELVLGQCVACHSADYITTQPPLDRAAWAASVEKMRARYGAAVPTNVAPAIADYLAAQYGRKDAAR